MSSLLHFQLNPYLETVTQYNVKVMYQILEPIKYYNDKGLMKPSDRKMYSV